MSTIASHAVANYDVAFHREEDKVLLQINGANFLFASNAEYLAFVQFAILAAAAQQARLSAVSHGGGISLPEESKVLN